MPQTPKPTTLELPPARLLAAIQPGTFDKERRTFLVALYAGATMQRYSWARDEFFELQLEVSSDAVDLSQLKSGKAPFLLNHDDFRVEESVAGVFEDAWLEAGKLIGRVRASGRERFREVFDDVAAGILGQVSVGTDILESVWANPEGSKLRRMTAKRWKPFEGSLVAVGADPGAVVLSRERRTTLCTLLSSDTAMDETNEPASPAPVAQTPAGGTETARAAATRDETSAKPVDATAVAKLERERIRAIEKAGAKLKAKREEVDALIDSGASADKAREVLLEKAADRDDATATNSRVELGREPRDGARAAMEVYLMHRLGKGPLTDPRARDYVGLKLLDLARECCALNGVQTRGKTPLEVVRLAFMSTSDFPLLLENIAGKSLQNAYMAYQSGWRSIVRVVPAADFKQLSSISLGDMPPLLEVLEGGEFKRGSIPESAEKYALATYGRVAAITRQAIVNDDMDGFSRIPAGFGVAAGSLVADLVFGILTTNAALSDSIALFHATHGNLGDKVLGIAGLSQIRALMRKQTGPNGLHLNVSPAYVVVPAALETEARQLLSAEIFAATTATANVHRGTAEPIVEPRLDAVSSIIWFAVANPSMMDGLQVSFLEGAGEGPMIESRQGFDIDGQEIKVRMDVAAKAVQFRGLAKSSGTV